MPSVPWMFESSKIFKKIKKISKFQKGPKSFPKVFKRVLNKFWGKFFEKFLPSFPWSVESSKRFKKLKKFSKFQPKTHKTVPKRIQKCFEQVLGQIFRKIFAQFSMGGRVFENFQKKHRIFKVPKKPKIVTKSVQTCFQLVLGQIFPKPVIPVFHGGSSLRKFSKNSKNFQNSNQKRTKSFPKASKRVLNVIWGEFFEKNFAQCSMDGRVFKYFQKNQKNFKIPKMPKIVPKSIQTCFEQVLGQIFRKIFAQFPMECRVFETFQKKSKNFQNSNQKRTKPFPKESKSVLNKFWGKFFEKIFAQFSMGGRVFENFQKKQRIFKVPKKPKIVTKSVQTCFELVLGQIFPKKLLSQCSMEARVFENFQKNQKNVKIPKMPQIVPKSIQTCFEHVLGRIFRKIFCPVFHGCSSLQKFSKKSKKFQNSKKAQNRSQKYSNVF